MGARRRRGLVHVRESGSESVVGGRLPAPALAPSAPSAPSPGGRKMALASSGPLRATSSPVPAIVATRLENGTAAVAE